MARLIRGPGASPLLPRSVRDAQERAATILASAEADAAARRAEAEETAARIRADAALEGRREALAEAAAVLATARIARDRALADAEAELVTLSIAIARRLVGDSIALDPRLVSRFAEEAIERARGAAWLRVRVAPDDVTALAELAASHRVPVSVEPDATLSPGDCIVLGDVGTVDARLETKLSSFRDALLRELGRETR